MFGDEDEEGTRKNKTKVFEVGLSSIERFANRILGFYELMDTHFKGLSNYDYEKNFIIKPELIDSSEIYSNFLEQVDKVRQEEKKNFVSIDAKKGKDNTTIYPSKFKEKAYVEQKYDKNNKARFNVVGGFNGEIELPRKGAEHCTDEVLVENGKITKVIYHNQGESYIDTEWLNSIIKQNNKAKSVEIEEITRLENIELSTKEIQAVKVNKKIEHQIIEETPQLSLVKGRKESEPIERTPSKHITAKKAVPEGQMSASQRLKLVQQYKDELLIKNKDNPFIPFDVKKDFFDLKFFERDNVKGALKNKQPLTKELFNQEFKQYAKEEKLKFPGMDLKSSGKHDKEKPAGKMQNDQSGWSMKQKREYFTGVQAPPSTPNMPKSGSLKK